MRWINDEKYLIDSDAYNKSKYDAERLMKDDIQAAKELHYPAIVVKLLENEPDFYKRQHILTNARNGLYD